MSIHCCKYILIEACASTLSAYLQLETKVAADDHHLLTTSNIGKGLREARLANPNGKGKDVPKSSSLIKLWEAVRLRKLTLQD